MWSSKNEKDIARLHYLTQDNVPGYDHATLAQMACLGGVQWIQLRVKDKPQAWETIARQVKQVTDAFGAKLIINDNVHIAQAIGAHGVHLGKTDMPIEEARQILGPDAIIGGTANSKEDLQRLLDTSADYIGLGPYRFTSTKKNLSPVLPFDELQEMLALQNRIPVIVIGGIRVEDVNRILEAGAHGVAVSSAINLAKDITHAAQGFAQLIPAFNLKTKTENVITQNS